MHLSIILLKGSGRIWNKSFHILLTEASVKLLIFFTSFLNSNIFNICLLDSSSLVCFVRVLLDFEQNSEVPFGSYRTVFFHFFLMKRLDCFCLRMVD
jgi:hypothetical protein